MYTLLVSLAVCAFLNFTDTGKKWIAYAKKYINYRFLMWKHHKFYPWMSKNKDGWFLTTLAQSAWFPWYGRRIVHVKPKLETQLTATEADIKNAIRAKDYALALELVNSMTPTLKTNALKQLIEVKLENLSHV